MSAIASMSGVTQAAHVASPPAAVKAARAGKDNQSFGFADILDIINPLQHIPVISTLYRKLTGDLMSPTAEILGGALFGGIIGAVTSVADVLWTQATGKDFGDTVYAWLGFDGKNSKTQLAEAKVPPKPVASVLPAAVPKASEIVPGLPALLDAMKKQGVSAEIAARAAAAYSRAIGLTDEAAAMAMSAF